MPTPVSLSQLIVSADCDLAHTLPHRPAPRAMDTFADTFTFMGPASTNAQVDIRPDDAPQEIAMLVDQEHDHAGHGSACVVA